MISPHDFDQIYHQYKDMVYNLALHYVQNTAEAEDISQEVFIKIYQRWDQYNDQTASIKTWITRIAIHQSLDAIKARKTKKRFGVMISIFNPHFNDTIAAISHFDHPGVLLEQKAEIEGLFKLINELPENQKTAMILNKIEDRSIKEVAVIMDTTEKAVESLMSRAKQTIAKKMKVCMTKCTKQPFELN